MFNAIYGNSVLVHRKFIYANICCMFERTRSSGGRCPPETDLLYIYLFFRMLKENKEREEKYQTMILNATAPEKRTLKIE